jgi:hypothetical protein
MDDRFIATAETETTTDRTNGGKEYRWQVIVKRSRIDWRPDFEKLGAFVMDGIPEGTRLINRDPNDHTYAYEWRNGQAVSIAPDGGTLVGRLRLPGREDLSTVLAGTRSLRATFTPASAPGNKPRGKSRHTMTPGKDGAFRIEDVPPGIYFLHLVLTETVPNTDSSGRTTLLSKTVAEADREFSIPESKDSAQTIVNLGVIEMAL